MRNRKDAGGGALIYLRQARAAKEEFADTNDSPTLVIRRQPIDTSKTASPRENSPPLDIYHMNELSVTTRPSAVVCAITVRPKRKHETDNHNGSGMSCPVHAPHAQDSHSHPAPTPPPSSAMICRRLNYTATNFD